MPVFFYLLFVLLIVSSVLIVIGLLLGLLKAFYNVDELISSYLFSSALIPTLNYLIIERMKGNSNMLLATNRIDSSFVLKTHRIFMVIIAKIPYWVSACRVGGDPPNRALL